MATRFNQIIFNEEEHTYSYQGIQLTGANKKIKELQKPFDREGQAQRTSAKTGRPVEDILREWDEKGEMGRRKGTDTHQHIMKVLKGEHKPEDDPFLRLNNSLPEIAAFEQAWSIIKGEVVLDRDYVEWVIGDSYLGVAGTVDTMLFSYKTGLYHIWDWKTGKFDLDNRFQRLLTPFSDLQDCHINTFSLVTSLYRLIVEGNENLPMGDAYLVHLSSYGQYTIHKAIDYRDRLLAWLTSAPQRAAYHFTAARTAATPADLEARLVEAKVELTEAEYLALLGKLSSASNIEAEKVETEKEQGS